MADTPPGSQKNQSSGPKRGRWSGRFPESLRNRLRQAGRWAADRKWTLLALFILVSVPLVQTWVLGVLFLPKPPQHYVDLAYKALEREDWQAAQRVLERTPRVYTYPGPWRKDFLFIRAAVAYYQAKDSGSPSATELKQALRRLRQSQKAGFPAPWRSKALSWLIDCYYQLGQYGRALEALEQAPQQSELPAETLLQGVEAALRLYPPRGKTVERLLALLAAKPLSMQQQYRVKLARAQWQLHRGEAAAALKALKGLPRHGQPAARAALLRGEALLRLALPDESSQQEKPPAKAEQLEAAYHAFKQALALDTQAQDVTVAALYHLGRVLRLQGKLHEAVTTWLHLREQHGEHVAARAASWQLARGFAQLGQWPDALDMWADLAQQAEQLKRPNPYLSHEQARTDALAAHDQLLAQEQFAQAVRHLRAVEPLIGRTERLLREAGTYERWAQATRADPQADPQQRRRQERLRRLRYYRSGLAWARLATQRFDSLHYPDDLWHAAEAFLQARRYDLVLRVLAVYRRAAEPNPREVETAVLAATCHLAQEKPQQALAVLRPVLKEVSNHPLLFSARLLGAEAHVQLDQWKEAQGLLEENLYGGYLSPESVEWRQSLFRLGWLHYVQGEWDPAILRLEEAVARYPQVPEALRARYQLAQAYYQNAREQRAVIDGLRLASGRETAARKVTLQLQLARDHFMQVLARIHRRRSTKYPDPEEELIYLNSLFALAQIHRDLGYPEDAIATYLELTRVFGSWPAVLEAYVQLADLYQSLQRYREAKAAVAQAQRALKQLPAEAPFRRQTTRTRQQWTDYLSWLLQAIP